ncbi:hypothetical protein I2I11_03915 [Pontibacter sp. 172403-2]|uniref:hypothetical protein n=1 Tax=Pontibacter rufus TaxID=2791028 RepID=UPI0018AF5611|nr:hypothetical protein [Pontibacter sp. 172403-2]MBF9252430.1 hypothetical protein [Pontibacter sp. 172403-2]
MTDTVEECLKRLECFESKVKQSAIVLIQSGKGMYDLDILANAVLNRALSTISGFLLLTRANNFHCAAHLVRTHLDTYLRFTGAWLVEDPHEFARNVLKGEHIRNMKDRTGAKMTDMYLKTKLSQIHPWVEKVYEETSGYIHLSNKHVFNSSILKDESTSAFSISSEDLFVSDKLRIEATELMIEITNCICQFVSSYSLEKVNQSDLGSRE